MSHGRLSTLALVARIAVLEQMVESIEADPPIGEAEFADAVGALVLSGVRGVEIGRMLGVESSCVTRWTRNGATPHPVGRKAYARHLPRIARRQIEALREQLGSTASGPEPVLAEAA